MIDYILLIGVACLICYIVMKVNSRIDSAKAYAELQQFAIISCPLIISSTHPSDRYVQKRAEYIKEMIKESGNQAIDCNKDIIVIPYNGFHDGKNLVGLSFLEYQLYISDLTKKTLEGYSKRVAAMDSEFANKNISLQN